MIRRVRWPLAALTGLAALAAAVVAIANTGSVNVALDPNAGPSCVPPPPGTATLQVDGAHPAVLLHVPRRRVAGRRSLVLVLPGAGQTGHDMASYTGYSRLAEQKGFLVAYPTATGKRPFWNVSGELPGKPDDVAYLRNVITSLTGQAACADPERVYVTGVSNGGGMSARLACDAADLLAAAAPVAGGYSTLPACEPRRPLPVLEIHGLRDGVVPYEGKGSDRAGNVDEFITEWRTRDRCSDRVKRTSAAPRVQELRWQCAAGRVVVQDRVADGEHGWPGESSLRPFSSTLRTWEFLSAFRDELAPVS